MIPYIEKELREMMNKSRDFASLCLKSDSLGRGLAWSRFAGNINSVLIEEEIAGHVFPSINNPNRVMIK